MSVSEPGKIITPWAESGLKNPIPPAANPATGRAGFDQGFSAINMTAKEAGGIPPFGQDFNGILFSITEVLRYMQAGGRPTFSSSMATAIGGYPKGAIVLGSDGVTQYQNQTDGNTNNPDVTPAGWLQVISNPYPVGAPIPWPLATPPTGFLMMQGQSFSAVTYPKLARAYPGLVLPDMRAEFIRGWDNGLGVDAGRALLSAQSDAIRNITGQLYGRPAAGNSSAGVFVGGSSPGAFSDVSIGTGTAGVSAITTSTNAKADVVTFSAANVVPTAADNRPRNIAFNYIVRAA